MGQVTLKINGYPYVLGCPDGQEAHLRALGAELDTRVSSLRAELGNLGEARLLAIVAIKLADELADAKAGHAQEKGGAAEAETVQRLTRLARRLDGVASKLARA